MARGTWGGGGDPHVFQVTVRFRLGLSICQFGFKLRDALVQDNSEQEVADEVATVMSDTLHALMLDSDRVEGVDAKILGQDTGAYHNYVGQAGTMSGTLEYRVPTFMSANIALKSEIRKRYGQGRLFLPVRLEGHVDGDSLSTAGMTHFTGFVDALTEHFTGDTATHDLILVNAHGALPIRAATPGYPGRPAIPASWYDVVTVRINSLVTSLRSRKAGVGS